MKTRKSKRRNRHLLIFAFSLMVFVTLAAVSVTAWALFAPKTQVLMPDYAPQEEDKNAVAIKNETSQSKDERPQGGHSVTLSYSPNVTISLSEKKISLLYQNPSSSNSDVILQLVVQDQLLAESGKLVPGKMLRTMDLTEDAAKMLQAGTYKGMFVVQPYDTESAEKAMLDSNCLVTITVLP